MPGDEVEREGGPRIRLAYATPECVCGSPDEGRTWVVVKARRWDEQGWRVARKKSAEGDLPSVSAEAM
jgi:hypothetical protein